MWMLRILGHCVSRGLTSFSRARHISGSAVRSQAKAISAPFLDDLHTPDGASSAPPHTTHWWDCTTASHLEVMDLWKANGYKLNGPLTRYPKLRIAHAPGMPGAFSPPPLVSDPDMHHGTCLTHVPWCMVGSLTSGFLCNRRRGKRSRHSRRMRNPQFCVSDKRPMVGAIMAQKVADRLYYFHANFNNNHLLPKLACVQQLQHLHMLQDLVYQCSLKEDMDWCRTRPGTLSVWSMWSTPGIATWPLLSWGLMDSLTAAVAALGPGTALQHTAPRCSQQHVPPLHFLLPDRAWWAWRDPRPVVQGPVIMMEKCLIIPGPYLSVLLLSLHHWRFTKCHIRYSLKYLNANTILQTILSNICNAVWYYWVFSTTSKCQYGMDRFQPFDMN